MRQDLPRSNSTISELAFFVAPGYTILSRSRISSRSSTWCRSRPLVAAAQKCSSNIAWGRLLPRSEMPPETYEEEGLDEKAMRAAEIHEVLQGLQNFKERIINDATKLAKKVRANKKDLERTLENHPDILKIDRHVKDLNDELKQLGDREYHFNSRLANTDKVTELTEPGLRLLT